MHPTAVAVRLTKAIEEIRDRQARIEEKLDRALGLPVPEAPADEPTKLAHPRQTAAALRKGA